MRKNALARKEISGKWFEATTGRTGIEFLTSASQDSDLQKCAASEHYFDKFLFAYFPYQATFLGFCGMTITTLYMHAQEAHVKKNVPKMEQKDRSTNKNMEDSA